MESNIYQLLYLSTSASNMEDHELLALLESSRKNNKRKGITGFMLYNDGNIIQLLEGDKEVVENLFLTIAKDMRHYGLIRLFNGLSQKRDFPDWSMGFRRVFKSNWDGKIEGINTLMDREEVPQKELAQISGRVRIFIDSFRLTNRLTRNSNSCE